MAKLRNTEEISNQNRLVINEYIEFLKSLRRKSATLEHQQYTFERLAIFLGDTDFKDATDKQLQEYFKTIKSNTSYNITGTCVIKFFVWLFNLDKGQRPTNMKWFEYLIYKGKEADNPEGVKVFLITKSDYNDIIEYAEADFMKQWPAIWEVFWLSGGRLGEVQGMNIGDVKISGGNVTLILRKSKTTPREVPLAETPELLLRWLKRHPDNENKEAPLWISLANKNFGQRISAKAIQGRFWTMKKDLDLKETLSIHCFRKTRATLMFNQRSKDGGLIYGDTHMAKFFGWKTHTVSERRNQYDLTTQEDLNKIVFNGNESPIETFEIVKQQKERLENQYKAKIESMEKQMAEMKENLTKEIMSQVGDLVKSFTN